MIPVELLIMPLRVLVTMLGTGVMPPGNVAEQIPTNDATLVTARDTALSAADQAAAGWQGQGAAAANAAIGRVAASMTEIATEGDEIAELVESAALTVHTAYTQLTSLLDDFARAATALGPALYTPTGFAALLPVALSALQRGFAVISAAQVNLADDTAAMAALGRRAAPAETAVRSAVPSDAVSTGGRGADTGGITGGVAVTLPDGSVVQAPNERAATAVRAALSQQGVPYQWGGTTPDGFDCSGFTQWAYRQAGVELPRLAQDQDTAGFAVSQANLAPGDLAVWSGHVAMYIGNGQFVETGGDPVAVTPLRTSNAGQSFEGFFRPR